MNIRKPTDYSALFAALDKLMTANLPQMELCRGIGSIISGRLEKGAAVAAAEYLQGAYPDATGFSPRSLRRMRDFYRTYESAPEVIAKAMTIGWTQNVVIMEADLTLQEKTWYIQAVRQFGWSKLELAAQITASAHLEISLDLSEEVCYTEKNSSLDYPPGETQAGSAWYRLRRKTGTAAQPPRLRRVRPPDRDGTGQHTEYSLYLRRRCWRQEAFADGLCRPSRRWVYGQFRVRLAGCIGWVSWAAGCVQPDHERSVPDVRQTKKTDRDALRQKRKNSRYSLQHLHRRTGRGLQGLQRQV